MPGGRIVLGDVEVCWLTSRHNTLSSLEAVCHKSNQHNLPGSSLTAPELRPEKLYKGVFVPSEPRVAYMLFVLPFGSHFQVAELQAAWAARVFAGELVGPDKIFLRNFSYVQFRVPVLFRAFPSIPKRSRKYSGKCPKTCRKNDVKRRCIWSGPTSWACRRCLTWSNTHDTCRAA